jgi:hypothetical protein
MKKQSTQWFIPIVLAAGAGLALWYYWSQLQTAPAPEAAAPQPAAEAPAELPAPLHPMPSRTEPEDRPELVPLPPLGESDEYFKLEVVSVFGDVIDDLLVESRLIERIVATVDNLPRDHVAERIRPVGRLSDPFIVDGQDGSGEFTISTSTYRRYDALVGIVTSANLQDVTDVYRRFYPLMQKAYVDLGYPDGYFNDRVVEVIDHLLETPQVTAPVELVRPHVLYEFRDPQLEALSSGQKLLIRMGNDNADALKRTLRELRAYVTTM